MIPSSEGMGVFLMTPLDCTVAKKFLYVTDAHRISLVARTAICLNDKSLSVSVKWSPEELLLDIS